MAWIDWIDGFMEYTEGIPTSEIFRTWSAIAGVGGALERRVWVETARRPMYPNLFTLLVGPPGSGKTEAITPIEDFWVQAKKFQIAPSSITNAALIDAVADADKKIKVPGGGIVEYHTLLIAISEFGVLVSAHDLEMLSTLNYIYDNPKVLRQRRRHMKHEIEIINPQLNILAGTQPGFLASLLPDEAWSMGFTSRLVMVYSSITPRVSLFDGLEPRQDLYKQLLSQMIQMSNLMGKCIWEDDAKREMERWAKAGMDPVPSHSKLASYVPRRIIVMLKLCMISAVSRTGELLITMFDLNRARDWLLHAEQLMPDIFREMSSRSDREVIAELHFFMWRMWQRDKQPIHESRLVHFLQTRVPSEKIMRVLDIAEKANIISRVAGSTTYIPRPQTDHGVE